LICLVVKKYVTFTSLPTRGNPYKLYKAQCENLKRRSFFTERIVNVWNSLPANVYFSSLPVRSRNLSHKSISRSFVSSIWHQRLEKQLCLSDPAQHGWESNWRLETRVSYWTNLGDMNVACALMLHCTCVKACKGNCKCSKVAIRCTPLCKCEGGCCNNMDWYDLAIQDDSFMLCAPSNMFLLLLLNIRPIFRSYTTTGYTITGFMFLVCWIVISYSTEHKLGFKYCTVLH